MDICLKISMLSSHLAMPRQGHLEQPFHIFAHLNKYHNSELVFDPLEQEFEGRNTTFNPAIIFLLFLPY